MRSAAIEGNGHRECSEGRGRWFTMNFSTAAVMAAAVAACNGPDPRTVQAAKAQLPVAVHDAAPVAMSVVPPAAGMDAHPVGAVGPDAAAVPGGGDERMPAPEID